MPSNSRLIAGFALVVCLSGVALCFDRAKAKVHGNYTLCALLNVKPEEEAARVKAEYHLDCEP